MKTDPVLDSTMKELKRYEQQRNALYVAAKVALEAFAANSNIPGRCIKLEREAIRTLKLACALVEAPREDSPPPGEGVWIQTADGWTKRVPKCACCAHPADGHYRGMPLCTDCLADAEKISRTTTGSAK